MRPPLPFRLQSGQAGFTGARLGGATLCPEPISVDEPKITVLAVNDNADHLYLQQVMLRQVGYNVLTAYDGREAFDVLRREHVDIIISDVMMPGIDGIGLCRLVRSHPTLNTLPIFLVSALRKDTASVVEGLR